MAESTCYTSVDICALRVAKLTAAGAPDTGADNGYVTDATISLGITVEVRDGEELEQINGCGAICATLKEPDKVKRVSLDLDLCQLDAFLIEFLTGASTFVDGSGDAIGQQLPAVGTEAGPTCVEAWSKAWDDSSQAVDPFTTPNETYIHWVFPFTRWVQGAFTLEHQLMIVPLTGDGAENDQITADGPFDDWPVEVAGVGGVTRIGGWFFDPALPTVACQPITVTSTGS